MKTTYYIPSDAFPAFEKRMQKLKEKAVRMTGYDFTFMPWGEEARENSDGSFTFYREVHLMAHVIELGGWKFVGRIDHDRDGNFVTSLDGRSMAEWHDAKGDCQHCNHNRYRKTTYIVEHETDGIRQVGSTCLKDFTGVDPHAIAAYAEILRQINASIGEYEGAGSKLISLHHIIQASFKAVDHYGYVSMKDATEDRPSTAVRMTLWMNSPSKMDHDPRVEKAIEWAISQGEVAERTGNDFLHNISVLAKRGLVAPRQINFAVAIVGAYLRSLPQKSVGGLEAVIEIFDNMSKALKHPKVVLMTSSGTEIVLRLAGEKSQYAGAVNVTDSAEYEYRRWFGRINRDGTWAGRKNSDALTTEVYDLLNRLGNDTENVLREYGRMTGNCALCRRALKDKKSLELGYGPICAKRIGIRAV